jgi:hypothetical protein
VQTEVALTFAALPLLDPIAALMALVHEQELQTVSGPFSLIA